MSFPLSMEVCARCDRLLYVNNRNAERLCGLCSKELSYGSIHQKPFKEWVEAGKPRITRPPLRPPAPRRKPRAAPGNGHDHKSGPDPHKLDTSYLIACYEELRRRREDAHSILQALGEE